MISYSTPFVKAIEYRSWLEALDTSSACLTGFIMTSVPLVLNLVSAWTETLSNEINKKLTPKLVTLKLRIFECTLLNNTLHY